VGDAAPTAWRPTRWSREAVALLPDLARLLRDLVADPRTPRRAKLVAAGAVAYLVAPVGGRAPRQLDRLVVVLGAVRYVVAAAGYELVRERWTGTDAGFSLLIVLTGVER
jgi:hypothetical protein